MPRVNFPQPRLDSSDPGAADSPYESPVLRCFAGVGLRRGAAPDETTIIAASSSTKNGKIERNPEMHQTREGSQWFFGTKAHISVDSKEGQHQWRRKVDRGQGLSKRRRPQTGQELRSAKLYSRNTAEGKATLAGSG
jgi:hypothetical protein